MKIERGSAALESIFAIVLLMVIALGTMQVAFLLYARNTVQASVHEAARAAIERGADASDATLVAQRVIESGVGGMVDNVRTRVALDRTGSHDTVVVVVRASVRPAGPVPIEMPLLATARLTATGEPR